MYILIGARNLRNNVLDTFTTSYKLQTLSAGAVVREWPKGYSVWSEDSTRSDGYRLLQTYANSPSRETVDELFDVSTVCITYL